MSEKPETVHDDHVPSHEKRQSLLEQLDRMDIEEFEVTVDVDEHGDPERYHITSITPRVRK